MGTSLHRITPSIMSAITASNGLSLIRTATTLPELWRRTVRSKSADRGGLLNPGTSMPHLAPTWVITFATIENRTDGALSIADTDPSPAD